jgi:hypothetical protein
LSHFRQSGLLNITFSFLFFFVTVHDKKYGEKIGNIRVVAPTSANDIALLVSTQSEAQALLDILSDITSKDLVKINPSKSELVPLTKRYSDCSLRMDTEEIKQTTETKHLGIKRNSKVFTCDVTEYVK